MKRRDVLSSLGVVGVASVAGCSNLDSKPSKETYGVGDEVTLSDDNIVKISEIRTVQSLFVEPTEDGSRIIGEEGVQYIVFGFDVSRVSVDGESPREFLVRQLQYQLSADTVAPIVNAVPRVENQTEGIVGVAFQVGKPFSPAETSLRLNVESSYVWPAEKLFGDEYTSYLKNPPNIRVDQVTIPDSATSDTATARMYVVLSGERESAEFNLVVSGSTVQYVREQVVRGENIVSVDVDLVGEDQEVVLDWGVDRQSAVISR